MRSTTVLLKTTAPLSQKLVMLTPLPKTSSSARPPELEKFQWFIRSHIDDGQGNIK